MIETLFLDRITTPTGVMSLITDEYETVRTFEWKVHSAQLNSEFTRKYGSDKGRLMSGTNRKTRVHAALEAYFDGDLSAFDGLRLKTSGTEFQHRVWTALRTIPVGTTVSYATIAERIGNPKAMRAVGLANGANPIAIIVPCHRVIATNGNLTGFGGGLDNKLWLLRHEGALVDFGF